MIISIIAAMDENRGIGKDNALPWAGKIPRDMAHFKELTLGKPVIMGRKTFESIGKKLPGRLNIVLTRDEHWQAPGIKITHSLDDALALVDLRDCGEAFVIGGAGLFQEALPLARRLYLTEIDEVFHCDTFFPEYDESAFVRAALEVHQSDERNRYKLKFLSFERKSA